MSIWWDGKDQYFKIIGEGMNNNWVIYENVNTKKTYRCYREAFNQRFREITNVKSCRRITGG